ncbi:MAG: transporter substrate-binding domain-containing protein [Desulfococcaceae bacterium]|nr:transporter substrate-binding domain-containing protein [Desulfococcaceae bacterium]
MKFSKQFITGGLLLCLLALAVPYAAGQETLILSNGEWPPYYGEKLPHYGFDSHIVTEAFALAGIKVEYRFFPWARALKMSEEGNYDGGVGWGNGAEFHKYHYVSDPTSEYEYVFFYHRDRPFEWGSFADIKGLKVGLTRGYDYPSRIRRMAESGEFKADRVSKDELNFKKLLIGRIDVFPNDRLAGILQMQQIFTSEEKEQILYHSRPIEKKTLHLILSKKNKKNEERMNLFNKGLKTLKENGRYDIIMQAAVKGEYNPE